MEDDSGPCHPTPNMWPTNEQKILLSFSFIPYYRRQKVWLSFGHHVLFRLPNIANNGYWNGQGNAPMSQLGRSSDYLTSSSPSTNFSSNMFCYVWAGYCAYMCCVFALLPSCALSRPPRNSP
ncbi:hypothetical protein K432DRAFT_36926 [Lepidopterella palustris CBS 459.81]|uniref:Uncharacterized protein n=1 Tax=Lepidopterella palustris CBS 459.81 TaxID=1314670 RepID=A0A8E2EBW1_9PEZI|nr:hypothetical protein K432DRAFT_36926 [Lepidopterella palustris CBS 459.81]